jgi:butyryl-CoA dehydrogenase
VDFDLDEDTAALARTLREFADTRIKPEAARHDKEQSFPHEVVDAMKGMGLFGLMIPERYGGAGLSTVAYSVAIEEISRADAAVGVITAVHNSVATYPLLMFGSEAQKERFLPALARGERIGAFCLSEHGSGSDAQAMETTAKREAGGWVVNGTKMWVSNGEEAGLYILFARTPEFEKVGTRRSISAFAVEREAKGIRVSRKEDKLGVRADDTCEMQFTDVRLPHDAILGEPGVGFRIAMATLDGGRIGIGAQAVGIAQAAFEDALAYAKMREQFGRPIGSFQAIQWKLADAHTKIEAGRLLVRQAAWRKDQGMPFTREAAAAKLFAATAAREITREMLQVLGGVGYTSDYPLERYYRDAKVTEIYEGTNEIQRIVLARSMLDL